MYRVISFLLLTTSYLMADYIGNIKGNLVDLVTKQPLIGANVSVIGTNDGATTDEDGYYVIEKIPEDIYKLEIQYIGYITYLETDVRVIRNKTTYVKEIGLTQSILESQAIEVSAGSYSDNDQAPVSNYSYSREEIKRSPGAAGDIFRAIETLPGVSSSGGEFSAFSVRGGSPKENIVLVDDIPFDKVSHFVGGSQDEEIQGGRFSIFTPGLIEEAEFQAGGFSAEYGGKNASKINLKIREGNKEDFTVESRYDFLGWELNYDGPTYALDNTSMLLSARSQDFKRIFKMTDKQQDGHPRFNDYIFKSTTRIGTNHKISFLGLYSSENMDRDVKHLFYDSNLENVGMIDMEEQKYLLGLSWRFLTSISSYLHTSVYFERSHTNVGFDRAYPDTMNGILPTADNCKIRNNIRDVDEKTGQIGIKSKFINQLNKNIYFISGIEINQYQGNLDYIQNGFDTVYVFGINDYKPHPAQKYLIIDPLNFSHTYDDTKIIYSGFSEMSYTFGNRLTITPGIRLEYSENDENYYIAPRFSSRYMLNPKTSLNFASGIYYQRPDFRVMMADSRNYNLKNEQAVHFILGMSRTLSSALKLTVETYYKTFEDLIVAPDRTTNYARNTGDGWAWGIDLSLIHRFVDNFYGQINYSYAVSKRDDHDGLGEYNSDFNQPHIFNILGGYQLNDEWSFSAKWKYATGRPTDSYVVHQNIFNNPNLLRYSQEITGKNDRRFIDFHTLNIRIDYRKQIWSRLAIVAYLDLLNAYGHENYNTEVFLERSGKVKYEGFGLLPSFGIKLEL